jgi:hypothetical protein
MDSVRPQAHPQTVHMGPALGGRNQIDITFGYRLAVVGQPEERPFGGFVVAGHVAGEGFLGQPRHVTEFPYQVIPQPFLVAPFQFLTAGLVVQAHQEPRTQHRLGAQDMPETRQGKSGRIKIPGIRPETDRGAGILFADRADLFQSRRPFAAGECHVVFPAIAAHPDFKVP